MKLMHALLVPMHRVKEHAQGFSNFKNTLYEFFYHDTLRQAFGGALKVDTIPKISWASCNVIKLILGTCPNDIFPFFHIFRPTT